NVPANLEIDADPDQLYRVLMNLVRNAMQALHVGGANQGEQPMVRVLAYREGATVTIDVCDNGPGVPRRAREHLFEAFQSTARPGGTGLGLAISAELTRMHGGWISLIETDMPGATFRIILPDQVVDLDAARKRNDNRVAGE
ncbi:MAG: ATP-binding protein, partial [Fimbriimonadaceae bacterium]|nr:ATP-binding protein [Alphaproteobacteria bacterium]